MFENNPNEFDFLKVRNIPLSFDGSVKEVQDVNLNKIYTRDGVSWFHTKEEAEKALKK